jgi:hypothetical protein
MVELAKNCWLHAKNKFQYSQSLAPIMQWARAVAGMKAVRNQQGFE